MGVRGICVVLDRGCQNLQTWNVGGCSVESIGRSLLAACVFSVRWEARSTMKCEFLGGRSSLREEN